jgi:nucleoside-diphosphate-sugar epimerase
MTFERALPLSDLESITGTAAADLDQWRGARLLVTGATGFFGRWLVESFDHANTTLGLGASLVGIAGPDEDIAATVPHLLNLPQVEIVTADIRNLRAAIRPRDTGPFDAIIHAAIQVDASSYASAPLPTIETGILGSWEVFELAHAAQSKRVLFLSSGGVYGAQPSTVERMNEGQTTSLDPTDPASAYGESKRAAETLAACYHRQYGLDMVIARPFSFVGPALPLDRHFAIGNFIRDALGGGPIAITSDGRPLRSYLYPTDLVVALWALLARGTAGRAYNIGSEEAIALSDVAQRVAAAAGASVKIQVRGNPTDGPVPRYLPDTTRIRQELGVQPMVSLDTAIARTIAWHRGAP